uniref:Peptidase C1A papain C-terminal domain-containing protein n=2 Tax=Zea mays TaxID=4577 RepID=A0A804QPI9_MAIZE
MEGVADPGPPPHTASPSAWAPPRRDLRRGAADPGTPARPDLAVSAHGSRPLARSRHALTVEAPLSATLARPLPASPTVTSTPAAPPPSDAPTTPPSPRPLSLPRCDAPNPPPPRAMVPSPPPPSNTCPRPRSPTISAATSPPSSAIGSGQICVWRPVLIRAPSPTLARDLRRRVFTTLARDLRRHPHLGQVRSAFGGHPHPHPLPRAHAHSSSYFRHGGGRQGHRRALCQGMESPTGSSSPPTGSNSWRCSSGHPISSPPTSTSRSTRATNPTRHRSPHQVMAMESQAEALDQLATDDLLEGKFALLETSSVDDDLSQLKKELSGSSLDVGEPGTAVEGHIMEDHSVDTNTREILEIPVLWFFFNLLWWQGAILGAYEILFVSGVLLTIGSKPTVQFFTKPKDHKCDSSEPDLCDSGCNGVQMMRPSVISKAGGLEREKDYRYTGSDGKCKFDKSKIIASIQNFSIVCG